MRLGTTPREVTGRRRAARAAKWAWVWVPRGRITVRDGFPLSIVEAIVSVANRRLDIAHRINEFAVVAEAVAADGLALMPRWTARPHPDVVLKPLGGVHARREVDVLHRPESTARKAVRTVLAELHRAAAQIQGRDR